MGKINFYGNFDTIWNVRIDGGSCDTPEGRKDFAGLVRTFVDKKIAQMQVNCLSSDVMRKAQQEPENYRDLIVRVVGYSANFVKSTRSTPNTLPRVGPAFRADAIFLESKTTENIRLFLSRLSARRASNENRAVREIHNISSISERGCLWMAWFSK